MANNFKEIAHLLRMMQHNKNVELYGHISKNIKGSGTTTLANVLYFRMLDIVCTRKNGDGDAKWILKPNSFSNTEIIKEWISEKGSGNMDSSFLLDYCAASTIKFALNGLIKSDLIYIDKFNKMHVKYPVGDKMLSPLYAYTSILSGIKEKNKKLDKTQEDGVLPESDQDQMIAKIKEKHMKKNPEFWELEDN